MQHGPACVGPCCVLVPGMQGGAYRAAMQAVIVDDEREAWDVLRALLQRHPPDVLVVGEA